ncbi:MAG: flagellar basal body P-ring protein FlgI [Alphaproteobacteria bacterium]
MGVRFFNRSLSTGFFRSVFLWAALIQLVLITQPQAENKPLQPIRPSVRLKDILNFEGVRENMLVGYGLVVGLNGTGDSLNGSPFTRESLVSMLERLGINTRDQMLKMKTKNVAAVMVTATLPAFSRHGSRIDSSISAMGDAKSLNGGMLLVTPLLGADGEVYAVSQGPVSTGGFSAQGQSGSSVTKGVPTSGIIPGGAIVEREIPHDLSNQKSFRLALKNPDFTTAQRVASAINAKEGAFVAKAVDPSTVSVNVPSQYSHPSAFIASIEQLAIQPDTVAKVVIDEQNGIIVMGENVRISTVAVAHGNLIIRIDEEKDVSQPEGMFSSGRTVVTPRSTISVDEETDRKMTVLPGKTTLKDLVDGLNALGVSPRDMITIIQNIAASGALQAQIEVR